MDFSRHAAGMDIFNACSDFQTFKTSRQYQHIDSKI